ncbi:GlcG protein [alpha proteobacterium AAP38]|uniref:GlcG/HbpS family heme-binding protein n=1 Tax=Niveispirillum sp. TaxID=1917217 RepID=UPI0006B8ABC5|nr:GlcG protein [alpha proteobacterium AAP38]
MGGLTYAHADMIIRAALEHARAVAMAPLAVTVLDAGGHPVALAREDGATHFRAELARGKAAGAVGMGSGSRTLATRAARNPAFFVALGQLVQGDMVPAAGGVLIRDAEGTVIGAVGISGDTSDRDEACALAGIAAAGLTADPGE